MLVLRCTKKLLTQFGAKPTEPPGRSTTRLGDWYAGTLAVGNRELLMFLSEPTYLAVLINAVDSTTVISRFRETLNELLMALEVSEDVRAQERDEGGTVIFAKTASRQALGVMNDFMNLTSYELENAPRKPLLEVSRYLSRTPCGPLKQVCAANAARELLGRSKPVD